MTNEKTEFESKGVPSKLITDNGNGYQKGGRGDHKDLVERNFQKTIDDSYQSDIPEGDKR
ncbi:MAG: hypothetical protein GY928_06315 [Colwellia sp.]|nr:hypothetical protein [Colwellia sp.]